MHLKKSPIIGAIAGLAIVIALGFALRGCKRSPEGGLRKYVGNQICLACGYEWHMDTKKMMEERLKDPTGNRFTQCPKCHEWRGVGIRKCAECGKPIPVAMMHVAPDGTITTSRRTLCDECAARGQPPAEGAHESTEE